MKKKILGLFIALVLGACVLIPHALPKNVQAVDSNYEIDGGRAVINFNNSNDLNKFDLYTEFGKDPWIMDGKATCWTLAEQKLILRGQLFSDVDVSVDIGTLNDHGKFNAGIYVHASSPNDQKDGITAWNVNLERAADRETYYLKLHRFDNGHWNGAIVEIPGLVLPMNEVNMRVVVKSGVLYAFINHEKTPRITYSIGAGEGYIGFRCYYSPNTFDNFSIISPTFPVDILALSNLVERANALDLQSLTQESQSKVSAMLSKAQELMQNAVNQYRVDECVAEFEEALANALEKYSYAELVSVIARAKALENNGQYTQNSWSSLQTVLQYCEALSQDSSEEEISYWTYRLEKRIDRLVSYTKGGVA